MERVATWAVLRQMRINSPAIALAFSLPLSSVTKGLRRSGLNKVPRLEPGPQVVRYDSWPGELIPLDLKKLGRIAVVGWATGITGDRS